MEGCWFLYDSCEGNIRTEQELVKPEQCKDFFISERACLLFDGYMKNLSTRHSHDENGRVMLTSPLSTKGKSGSAFMWIMVIASVILITLAGCRKQQGIHHDTPSIPAPGQVSAHGHTVAGIETNDFVLYWDGELLLCDTLYAFRYNPVTRTSTRYTFVNGKVISIDLYRRERNRSKQEFATKTYKQHFYP